MDRTYGTVILRSVHQNGAFHTVRNAKDNFMCAHENHISTSALHSLRSTDFGEKFTAKEVEGYCEGPDHLCCLRFCIFF